MQDREQKAPSRPLPLGALWAVLGGLAPLLAIGAIVVYAVLNTAYERFYGPLGVDPGDVGLTYTGTLARSSGFVGALLLLALVGFSVPVSILVYRWHQGRRLSTVGLNVVMALIGLVLLLLVIFPVYDVGRASDYVRAGHPIGSFYFLGSNETKPFFRVLATHAELARVEPAGKPEDAPSVARLQGRKVLYLGQANGTVVLYDPSAQQAIYVPANSIILHVTSCIGPSTPDPACG